MNDSTSTQRPKLRRVGGIWKPKPGSRAKGSGSITVNGLRQKFVILVNDKKQPGSNAPDYTIATSDEPEVDSYARDRKLPALDAIRKGGLSGRRDPVEGEPW